MTISTEMDGAIADPAPSQTNDGAVAPNGGALSTCIGIGARVVYDNAGLGMGFTDDEVVSAHRLGSLTDNDPFFILPEDVPLEAFLVWHVADVALADGDQDGVTGNYNRTGQAIGIGQAAFLVAAAP